jgi:hypothetical protein
MPDPAPFPDQAAEGHAAKAEGSASASPRRQGWPLWLRLTLAAVILAFVWSPFLAMLARLSQVRPSLQPTGGAPLLVPPPPAPRPATPGTAAAP